MGPLPAMHDAVNVALPYAKFLAERGLRFALRGAPAYLSNLFSSKFGLWISFAMSVRAVVSTFGVSIGVVFCKCTEPKMIRIHAQSIVSAGAIVEYTCAVGDRAKVNLPGEAMSVQGMPSRTKPAITIRRRESLPNPTFVNRTRGDVLPKTFLCWYEATIPMPLDKTTRSPLDVPAPGVCLFDDVGFLPTTAVAITVWDFVRGMICHVNTFLSGIDHARGHFAMSPWRFHWWGTTGVLYHESGVLLELGDGS
jgi:hypothetical protein